MTAPTGSPKLSAMEPQKRLVLFSGLTAFFLSIAMLYQMAPFFQAYARETVGADAGTVGVIFAILPAVSFVFSIPTGKLIMRVGERVCLSGGLLLLAVSSLMFGLSESVGGWMFWRAVQGAATAPIYSSISCMFAKTFTGPGEFAQVNGLQEAMANVGFVVGPLLGGTLYQYGGFFAPFGVSAVGHLIFVVFTALTPDGSKTAPGKLAEPLLEEEAETVEPEHAGLGDMLFGDFLLIAPAGMVIPGTFGALDPVIAVHLQACLGSIGSSTIGALMSSAALPSIILAVVVPVLMQRVAADWIVCVGVSLFAVVLSMLAITDPDSVDNLGISSGLETGGQAQWVLQVSLFLMLGTASSFGWTPVLPDLMEKACRRVSQQRGDLTREQAMEAVSPTVSSVFNAAAALGEAAGPILGGVVYARYGFSGTYVIFGAACAVYGLVILVYRLSHRKAEELPPKALPPKGSSMCSLHLRFAVTLPETLSARQRECLKSPDLSSKQYYHRSASA